MTRDRLDRAYRGLLKIAGLYGLCALCAFFAGVPQQIESGVQILPAAAAAVLGIPVAGALMRPRLLPPWFASPQRTAHLAPVLVGHGLLPLLFAVPCLGAVLALNLPDALSRPLAFGAAGVPTVLFGLCWCIGLALCLGRGDTAAASGRPADPRAPRVVPRRPRYPRLTAEQLADLRRQRGG